MFLRSQKKRSRFLCAVPISLWI